MVCDCCSDAVRQDSRRLGLTGSQAASRPRQDGEPRLTVVTHGQQNRRSKAILVNGGTLWITPEPLLQGRCRGFESLSAHEIGPTPISLNVQPALTPTTLQRITI